MAFQPGDIVMPRAPDGSIAYSGVRYTETWPAMEKLVDSGLVKHIGLSNFNSQQIDEVCACLYARVMCVCVHVCMPVCVHVCMHV